VLEHGQRVFYITGFRDLHQRTDPATGISSTRALAEATYRKKDPRVVVSARRKTTRIMPQILTDAADASRWPRMPKLRPSGAKFRDQANAAAAAQAGTARRRCAVLPNATENPHRRDRELRDMAAFIRQRASEHAT